MSEFEVHKKIIQHIRFRGIVRMLPMHIPNNPRNERHGAHLKAMGLLKGAPDMVYAMYDGRIAWHEIKADKGKLSPDQKDVHERLKQLGHEVFTTYGLDEAIEQLIQRGVIR